MVIMKIAGKRLLRDLQADFIAEFPFLDLTFRAESSQELMNPRLSPNLQVEDVRRAGNDGVLNLMGNITCTAFEQTMKDVFGLNVWVKSRKSAPGCHASKARTLASLNHSAMHMVEDVVIV